MSDVQDQRARRADNSTKIFNNRVKYLVFFLTVTTGMLTIWEKGSWLAHKPVAQVAAAPTDSPVHAETNVHRKDLSPLTHRHRSVSTSAKAEGGSWVDHAPQQGEGVSQLVTKPVSLAAPLERAEADDIEFRLMRAEGSIRAQTIKMTVVLITTAADWAIRQDIQSIIDDQGNEYQLKSFKDGASDLDTRIALNTGVPIRCTYTFGGVLPSVATIKLFKFQYWDKSTPGKVDWVEFRDIPVRWQ